MKIEYQIHKTENLEQSSQVIYYSVVCAKVKGMVNFCCLKCKQGERREHIVLNRQSIKRDIFFSNFC